MVTILMKKAMRTKLLDMYFTRNACISKTIVTKQRRYCASQTGGATELIKEKLGNKAVLTLNRGASKNSLTLELTNEIIATLQEWENDNQIAAIIFKAKGDTFCTGIDLRGVANVAENRDATVESVPALLESAFKLDYKLGTLKKPSATILNGVVYSSEFGSNHKYSVCTENAVFSMPETSYGLVPGCFFATRIPDKFALYLALTGECVKGRDLYNIGLATHYIRSAKLQNLENDLKNVEDIDAVIDGINRYRKLGENYKRETLINFYRIYDLMNNANSVNDIFTALNSTGDEWSKKQLETLSLKSPLALKITYKFFEKHECDLKECLKTRFRITKRLLACKDFQESLRSVIADKQTKPKWGKALSEIDDNTVKSFFEPASSDELKLE